eukprot:Rmarinus@m.8225
MTCERLFIPEKVKVTDSEQGKGPVHAWQTLSGEAGWQTPENNKDLDEKSSWGQPLPPSPSHALLTLQRRIAEREAEWQERTERYEFEGRIPEDPTAESVIPRLAPTPITELLMALARLEEGREQHATVGKELSLRQRVIREALLDALRRVKAHYALMQEELLALYRGAVAGIEEQAEKLSGPVEAALYKLDLQIREFDRTIPRVRNVVAACGTPSEGAFVPAPSLPLLTEAAMVCSLEPPVAPASAPQQLLGSIPFETCRFSFSEKSTDGPGADSGVAMCREPRSADSDSDSIASEESQTEVERRNDSNYGPNADLNRERERVVGSALKGSGLTRQQGFAAPIRSAKRGPAADILPVFRKQQEKSHVPRHSSKRTTGSTSGAAICHKPAPSANVRPTPVVAAAAPGAAQAEVSLEYKADKTAAAEEDPKGARTHPPVVAEEASPSVRQRFEQLLQEYSVSTSGGEGKWDSGQAFYSERGTAAAGVVSSQSHGCRRRPIPRPAVDTPKFARTPLQAEQALRVPCVNDMLPRSEPESPLRERVLGWTQRTDECLRSPKIRRDPSFSPSSASANILFNSHVPMSPSTTQSYYLDHFGSSPAKSSSFAPSRSATFPSNEATDLITQHFARLQRLIKEAAARSPAPVGVSPQGTENECPGSKEDPLLPSSSIVVGLGSARASCTSSKNSADTSEAAVVHSVDCEVGHSTGDTSHSKSRTLPPSAESLRSKASKPKGTRPLDGQGDKCSGGRDSGNVRKVSRSGHGSESRGARESRRTAVPQTEGAAPARSRGSRPGSVVGSE